MVDDMKNLNMKEFGVGFFLTLVTIIGIVSSLAITQPMPPNLRMLPGDTARFVFQVQAPFSKVKQSCKLSVSSIDPLKVNLDETSIILNAGETKKIYGTVSVPTNAPVNTYKGKIMVACRPYVTKEELSGSVISNTRGVDFVVNVVKTLGERNIPPVSEAKKPTIPSLSILGAVLIVVAIVGIYYWTKKK